MSKLSLLLLFFTLTGIFSAPILNKRQADAPSGSSQDADESDDQSEDDEDDPNQILEALDFDTKTNVAVLLSKARSRDELKAILHQTLDLLDHKKPAERHRPGSGHNETLANAKALGRTLLGNPRFGSSSSETDAGPSNRKRCPPDPDYCIAEHGRHASMAVTTMKKILDLRSKGRSHASLKKLYPRYRPDRLALYESCVRQQGEPLALRIKKVNDGVLARVVQAREQGRPVHGNTIRRWALELSDELHISRDYFSALYRRRSPDNGGQSYVLEGSGRLRGVRIDNSWVVPHSPLLSKMFNAHINVEYCNSVKSIKYICKYVNKGSDQAMVEVRRSEPADEIRMYQQGRYLCSSEAFWRIFSFPIHDRYPPVFRLAVHLPGAQSVVFNRDNAARRAEQQPETTLTRFFQLCQNDAFARTLLYADVPRFYTWNQSSKNWSKRRQGRLVAGYDGRETDAVGRIYTVHPNDPERFFLRILLTKVRGPTSYEDLRTVGGHLCATFREVCQRRGYLENDRHWEFTLTEASATASARQLRILLAIILANCQPANPMHLWESSREALTEDILNMRRRTISSQYQLDQSIFNEALIEIEDLCVHLCGRRLDELGLPSPNRNVGPRINMDLFREQNHDANALRNHLADNVPRLTREQRMIFDTLYQAIDDGFGGLYFIDAPGGTGKTFLINLLLSQVRSRGDIMLAVASSGIASTMLAGGRTAHSMFKVPINIQSMDLPTCSVTRNSNRAELFRRCKAIIWDEVTMSHRSILEAVNRMLQDIRQNEALMGGIVMILSGDFRQTLPVVERGTPADEINACLKKSVLWRHVRRFHLTTNIRVAMGGAEAGIMDRFTRQLMRIGDGTAPPCDPLLCKIRFPDSFCTVVPTEDVLIDSVFPDLQENVSRTHWLCKRAILLAPLNEIVDSLNITIQNKINGRERTYTSRDTVTSEEGQLHFPMEFLNSLTPPGIPPHELKLKIGSPIIVLRNLEPPKVCNGTRLVVRRMAPNIIEAVIIIGPYSGETVFIPRIPMTTDRLFFPFKRVQFPVKLAYAMTINKSQGQTLAVVGLHLLEPCFSHGQLYVGCSRVGNPSNLYILAPNGQSRNIVYQEALL